MQDPIAAAREFVRRELPLDGLVPADLPWADSVPVPNFRANAKPIGATAWVDRFLPKIDASSAGCWNWTAARNFGYGLFGMCAKDMRPAHRVAYELWVAVIPDGMYIDHLCRNRACVRPDHLELVTPQVNTLRGVGSAGLNGRKTSCINGHPYTEENTYWQPDGGGRGCQTCRDARNIAETAKKRVVNDAKRAASAVPAFGVRKSLAAWARDERCLVNYSALCYRINKMGVDPELAMTADLGHSRRALWDAKKN